MAVTIDWATLVIHVPQSYLTPLGGRNYRLDVDQFRQDLKALEASTLGEPNRPTHEHATARTLSGVTYARQVEIINGYTVEFQSVGTPYRVTCVGANHNIADVQVVNDVSLVIGNSAGLIVVDSGGSGPGATAPTAAQNAAAVWAASGRTLTSNPGPSAQAIADAVWDKAIP